MSSDAVSFEIEESDIKAFEKTIDEAKKVLMEQFLDDWADRVLELAKNFLQEGRIKNSEDPFGGGAFDRGHLWKHSLVVRTGNNEREVRFTQPHACVVGGVHKIQTQKTKRISEARINDMVLTKDGKYHKVKGVMNDLSVRDKPNLILVKPEKSYLKKGLLLTEDHLVLTKMPLTGYIYWEQIGNLKIGDIIFNLRKKAHNKGKRERTKNKCKACNKEFEVVKSQKYLKYCCKKCYYEDGKFDRAKGKRWFLTNKQRLNKSGKNNPAWKGGISKLPYGIEWTKLLKENIKIRDNFTCQECSKHQSKHKHSFHVHHIDNNKFNNKMDNLITLCPSCHGKKQWQDCELVDVNLERFKPTKIKEFTKLNAYKYYNNNNKKLSMTKLYDVHVDGENSFVVGGIIVHNSYIEYGTPPHHPPVKPLQQWAKRNKINNWKNVGWAIAKKIAKHGTPPKPFLRQAVVLAQTELKEIFKVTQERIES